MTEKIEIGNILKATVTGIENYGIFVLIDENIRGLIHISEISDSFVKDVNDYAVIGEEIYVRVIEIDNETNYLKLTIKNINYRILSKKDIIDESIAGFSPLADQLDDWINEKTKELNKNITE